RQAQRLPPSLPRHLVGIVARLRAEDGSAVTPQRRTRGAGARASGSLLAPGLAPAAGNQPAGLGRSSPGTAVGELHLDRLVQKRFPAAASEHAGQHLELADLLALGR